MTLKFANLMRSSVTTRVLIFAALMTGAVFGGAGSSKADVAPPPNAAALGDVIKRAQADFPGHILKLEFEHEDGVPLGGVFEVKILQANGVVVEVEYDAVSLKIVGVEQGDGRWKRKGDDDD